MKAILAVAVLAMAAFAGVMIVGDDADAATGTVTYELDGASKADTYNEDTSAVTLKSPSELGFMIPAGKEFKGWQVDGTGTVYMAGSQYAFEGNVKFIASLAEIQYDITFKVEDMDDVVITGTAADDIQPKYLEKFPSAPAKEGYIFMGWAVADETPVKVFNAKFSANITYNAVFAIDYKIYFTLNGSIIEDSTVSKVSAAEDLTTIIKIIPIQDNYNLVGWEDASGKIVIKYLSESKKYILDEEYVFTENTTLVAKFVPVTFTVTFVYGEEKAVFATETVKYGDLAIEPKGLPEGYKGWDWSFGTEIVADTEIVAIVADPVTVYTVTFEIDGKAPVTQRSDSMVLPDTKIEGKVFQGWVVKGESQYVSPMSYDITEDITFVAVYKEADPPAGPGFFETTTGQCVAVIIAVVIIALIYAVATNMFGLKDALTSVKIMRVKK